MNEMTEPNTDYKPSWLVELLHSLPHFDLTFQPVNSTFNYQSPGYRESLLAWTALPVIWLLLTLFMFLIYFCYRCCQRDAGRQKRVSCVKWTMVLFVLVAWAVIGGGMYGNEEMKRGTIRAMGSVNNSVIILVNIQEQLNRLESSVNESVTGGLNSLNLLYEKHPRLSHSVRQDLIQQMKNSFAFSKEILSFYFRMPIVQSAASTDAQEFLLIVKEQYAYYRWLITTSFLCWLVFLCVLLLLGICRSSKCTLLMFCTFGIFSLVKCYVSSGLHLGISMGLADYCDSPYTAAENAGSLYIDTNIIKYYTQCEVAGVVNPFKGALDMAHEKIREANVTVNRALEIAHKHITQPELDQSALQVYAGLADAADSLVQLTELCKCTEPARDYTATVNTFCTTILWGVVMLTLSLAASGLMFSLLICMASRTWRSFGSRENEETYPKPSADVSEDEGPFLPRHPAPQPAYYRYGAPSEYGRPGPAMVHDDFIPYRGNVQVQLALQRQANPAPPPYSTTDFYRHYNEAVNPYGRCGHPGMRESNA